MLFSSWHYILTGLHHTGIRQESCHPETTVANKSLRACPAEILMAGSEAFNFKDLRDNPVAVAKHLNKAFAKNDLQPVLEAINFAMRAQNVVALAKSTGLRRDRLYKTFGGDVNPQLGRVMALFAGLDVRLTVKPLPPKKKPPRPKLGRPPKGAVDRSPE
jgi:probable addiction module antidote protein